MFSELIDYTSFLLSRDERRWMEKQNRAMRQKRKKEETARIRLLVGKTHGLFLNR